MRDLGDGFSGEDALLFAERFGREVVVSEVLITTPGQVRRMLDLFGKRERERAETLASVRVAKVAAQPQKDAR